ncbi:GAF domain-containing protein [Streptomyces sp. NPDC058683]|uniref:GAF domain-containing protein n=1 Tax=Streptomyces sp. NPDC058683 TaxID=3346597 RepID=UPI00364E8430
MTNQPRTPHPAALDRRTPDRLLPHADRHLLVPPPDTVRLGQETVSAARAQELAEQQARMELIQHLGMPTGAHAFMDQFADHLAEATGMLYGFVNIFLDQQTFVGLHNPPMESGHLILGRTMSLEHGWCPAVVKRKTGLPLFDVHASPRFSGNFVVDAVGIRSYFGAPLIHQQTGIVLGTVCTIDPEARPQSDARRLLSIVKSTGTEVMHALRAA